MGKGGARENSGARSKWKNGKTKTVRVPENLIPQILEYAHNLDNGVEVTKDTSRTLNLSNVSIHRINGKSCIFLQDLVKLGYQLKPKKLSDVILRETGDFSSKYYI